MEKFDSKKKNEISKIEPKKFSIYLRQEVFDHLVFPLPIKLDENVIIQLFRKLHIISRIDYKISLENWIDQSLNFIHGLTEKDAIVLFNTYKIISFEFEISNQINKNTDYKNIVDVRYFGLFIALQCYSQKNKINIIDTLDKNAYSSNTNSNTIISNYNSNPIYNSNNFTSPLSSPRGKQNSLRNSNNTQYNEISNMINFVKNNIKLFLRLAATDIHNSETQLNSGEFNTLNFFFRIDDNISLFNNNVISSNINTSKSLNNLQKTGLAALAPFFNNFSSTTKVNIEKITDWLINMINSNPLDNDDHNLIIKNLSKCTTVKSDVNGKSIKILYAEDSQIFIDSCLTNLKIAFCTNCTIFAAGVTRITTVEKSEYCTITVLSNYLRIGNTIECKINAYSFQEPILYGNNIKLILGPHNAYYDEFMNTIKAGRFNFVDIVNKDLNNKNQITPIRNFSTPIVLSQVLSNSTSENLKPSFEILKIKEFTSLSTPFTISRNIDGNSFLLTPKEFLNEYFSKIEIFRNIQKKVKDADLDNNQEKALFVAIQGYFKEWLINTGNSKNITDIIKVIDYSLI